MKIPPFDLFIRVPTPEACRGCLDSGLQQVTVYAGEKATLPFDCTEVETRADDSDTESKHFTSRSDKNHDEEQLIVDLADVNEKKSTRSTIANEDFKQVAV